MSQPADEQFLAICARIDRDQLIAAECNALTGGVPDADGIAMCASIDRIDRAAYVQTGLRVIAHARTFSGLVGAVAAATFEADSFRIDVHDPSDRVGMSTQDAATELADVIAYGPNLRHPRHRFVVVAGADAVRFAEVVTRTDASYRAHDAKPWTTSASIDARLSRALVNLVPAATSILDPCCGAGSIVLEAASLGLAAIGVDWKPAMVGMTRENLAHFGYAATVERADSRSTTHTADAIVTDLPYGHAIDSDETVVRAILERGAAAAPLGVYVAPHDITSWLAAAGYADVSVHTVFKRRGFTRWVHLARNGVPINV